MQKDERKEKGDSSILFLGKLEKEKLLGYLETQVVIKDDVSLTRDTVNKTKSQAFLGYFMTISKSKLAIISSIFRGFS